MYELQQTNKGLKIGIQPWNVLPNKHKSRFEDNVSSFYFWWANHGYKKVINN